MLRIASMFVRHHYSQCWLLTVCSELIIAAGLRLALPMTARQHHSQHRLHMREILRNLSTVSTG
jgi:glucose dehydrogenase